MKKAQVKVKEKEVVVTLLKLLHPHPLLQVQVPLQFHRKNNQRKLILICLHLKLDMKFDLPMYNGELNAEKLDHWIKQIEVYCRVQKIVDEEEKFQLATLQLGGTTLIWWESKNQEDLLKKGKMISSWYEFIASLKKQFYPLGYMQQAIMDWQNLRKIEDKMCKTILKSLERGH
jgi:hypothetical protein